MTRKTVLITGGGSGIGRALAQEAARRGHRLILTGRRSDALQETARLSDDQALIVAADLTTPAGRAALLAQARDTGLDILINNAGAVCSGPAGELSDARIEALLAVNLAAPIALTRDLLPLLARHKGQVVNMGSVFGEIGFPFFALYSATKFALRGYSEALRREVAPQGIAVTHIAPRATRTDAAQGFARLIGPMAMTLDTPEQVARHAWTAIAARKRDQLPQTKERLFVALQRLRPGLIDRALIGLARDPAVAAAAPDSQS